MVKGLRVIADFEWESQMNQLDRLLAPDVETMYVMSSPAVQLRLLERRQGDRVVRRQGRRARARGGRPAVPRAVPDGRPGAPLSPQE